MVYLNLACFGVKLSCILRSFRPMNSRMQTFKCVGLLILHDLDLTQGGLKGSPMMLCAEVYREFVATRELLV